MKTVKRVLPYTVAAILLNFIFYFTLTVGGYSNIYGAALGVLSSPADIRDDDYSEFDLTDDDSLRSDSLFYYEVKPGYAVTTDFMLDAVKYYSREINARYIVCEFGYATSEYLNRYLEGDSSALATLFEYASGDVCTEEFLALLTGIKEYNIKLDERRQLRFVGIGIGSKEFTAVYIDSLYEAVSTKLQSEDVRALFTSTLRESDPDAYFSAIRDDMALDKQPYRELFTDSFNDFSTALDEYFADASSATEYMTRRIIGEYNRSVGGKFVLFVTDVSLYESIHGAHGVLFERTALCRFIYADDYSFGLDGTLSDVYTVDDRFLGFFEGWRSAVYSIAGKRFDSYRSTDREAPPLIFAALDLTPTTPTDDISALISDAELDTEAEATVENIWEMILNEGKVYS